MELTVFSAAGMTPVLENIKEDSKDDFILRTEFSGSHVACRKIAEFGRQCDMIISADKDLLRGIIHKDISFRLDFACDQIVLGVGKFAKFADEAQRDPFSVLLNRDVTLARADECLSPLGYMSLLVCMLREKSAPDQYSGLLDTYKKKTVYLTDDVMQIVPYLKSGQVDYALIFKSSCVANDIRFVSIPEELNLGNPQIDYSSVKIDDIPKPGYTVKGAPAIFSLSIPDSSKEMAAAAKLAEKLCNKDLLAEKGFTPLSKPFYYGRKTIYDRYFANFAEFCGEYF